MNKYFYRTAEELIAGEGQRLRGLIGQTLFDTWLVWDKAANEWFSDEFVILQFSEDCLGLNFSKFDELAVNWSLIDIQDSCITGRTMMLLILNGKETGMKFYLEILASV